MDIKSLRSVIAPGLFLSLALFVGVFSALQPTPAQASFGGDIVCLVFSDLNMFGSPIPHLTATDCPSTPSFGSGTLKVSKIVVGGTAVASDFSIHVKSGGTDISGSPQPGSVSGTSYISLAPGSYTVSETGGPANYTSSFIGCDLSGNISVASSSIPSVCTVTNTYVAPPPGAENTLALCSDGIDNNSNGLTDIADPSCAAFIPKLTVTKVVINDNGGTGVVSNFPLFVDGNSVVSGVIGTTTVGTHTVTETASSSYAGTFSGDCDASGHVTLAIGDTKACVLTNNDIAPGTPPATTQCNDGIDNDADGLVDSADPGCHTDFNAGNSESYNASLNNESAAPSGGSTATPTTGGGGYPDISGPRGGGGVISGPLAVGSGGGGFLTPGVVLGTSTEASCGSFLTSFLRMGRTNDKSEVVKLQTFLNNQLGLKIPVTGFFGKLTDAGVRKFQAQYAADVLAPWAPFGLAAHATTGYVYKTTLHKINLIMCTTLSTPAPVLP